jgi:hypothetical protein
LKNCNINIKRYNIKKCGFPYQSTLKRQQVLVPPDPSVFKSHPHHENYDTCNNSNPKHIVEKTIQEKTIDEICEPEGLGHCSNDSDKNDGHQKCS